MYRLVKFCPTDVLAHVLSFLALPDLSAAARVSTAFTRALGLDWVWGRACQQLAGRIPFESEYDEHELPFFDGPIDRVTGDHQTSRVRLILDPDSNTTGIFFTLLDPISGLSGIEPAPLWCPVCEYGCEDLQLFLHHCCSWAHREYMCDPVDRLPVALKDPRQLDPIFTSRTFRQQSQLLSEFEQRIVLLLRAPCTTRPLPQDVRIAFENHLPGVRDIFGWMLHLLPSPPDIELAMQQLTVEVMIEAAVEGFAVKDFYQYGLELKSEHTHPDNYVRVALVEGWAAWDLPTHDRNAYIWSLVDRVMSICTGHVDVPLSGVKCA